MTFYLDLPGPRGKLDRLLSEFGAAVLSGPPPGPDEVPADKALVCVGDMGDYEAVGYILTGAEFATWADPADTGPKTWLIMDRDTADMLCPGAAEGRESRPSGMEGDAEAAAHTDNLVPVARASRSGLRRDATLLRQYAAALRGALTGTRADELLTDVRSRRIASADLEAIAKDLESWAERDWIAVIDIGPAREHLAGPLPRFPTVASPDNRGLSRRLRAVSLGRRHTATSRTRRYSVRALTCGQPRYRWICGTSDRSCS